MNLFYLNMNFFKSRTEKGSRYLMSGMWKLSLLWKMSLLNVTAVEIELAVIIEPAVEKCSAFFFCNFVYFKSIGEKYAFPPLFSSPFDHFFPQPVIWPYFYPLGGGANRKIYTPVER